MTLWFSHLQPELWSHQKSNAPSTGTHNNENAFNGCVVATHYNEMERAASAANPLDFPKAVVKRATFVPIAAWDAQSHRVMEDKRALVPRIRRRLLNEVERAYVPQKRVSRTAFGAVHLCAVLHKTAEPQRDALGQSSSWVTTGEMVVLKASSLEQMRAARGKHLEDPLKEASALQFMGDYHDHILGCIELLQDDDYLYTVTKYCPGGTLYTRLFPPRSKKYRASMKARPNEETCRTWFKQLLSCLSQLERKGVCHHDLSLENLVLDELGNLKLIDFGLALRVPYVDDRSGSGVVDASEGILRRMIRKQESTGNLMYQAPEIIDGVEEFDGFAVDLWSAGVILFVMLVGMAPFECASLSDSRFKQINRGRLSQMLTTMGVPINPLAVDLLQKMMWRNPRKRLNLAQVWQHPWVVGTCKTEALLEATSRSDFSEHSATEDDRSDCDTPRRYFSPKGFFD